MKFEELLKDGNLIFRYRPISDNNIFALETNRLYFSIPRKFNDPFDNLLYVDIVKILCDIGCNLEVGMEKYIEKIKCTHPEAAFVVQNIWKGNDKEAYVEEYFTEVYDVIEAIKNAIKENVKIICLSERYDSMLMWSHYADNHKGYVLAYDIEDLKTAKRFSDADVEIINHVRVEKVQYVDKQVDLTNEIEEYVRNNVMEKLEKLQLKDSSIPQFKLREFVVQKSKEWEYEKEWRVIPRIVDIEGSSPLHYLECKPRAIIIGAVCDEKDRNKLITIAKKNGIDIYEMKLNEFVPSFKLEIEEN